MPRDFPAPEGFGQYGEVHFLRQWDGQKVTSLGLHLPMKGDSDHSDDGAVGELGDPVA